MFKKIAFVYFISVAVGVCAAPGKGPSDDQVAETSCKGLMVALSRWGTARITPEQLKAFQIDSTSVNTTIHRPAKADIDKALDKLNDPNLQFIEFRGRRKIKEFLFEWSGGYCDVAAQTWDTPVRKLTQLQEVELYEKAVNERPLLAMLTSATDLAMAGCMLAAVTGYLDWRAGLALTATGAIAAYNFHRKLVQGITLAGQPANNRVRFHANPAQDLMIDFPIHHADLFFSGELFAAAILDEPEVSLPRLRIVYLDPTAQP